VEASATWAIGWDKSEFLGSTVLKTQKSQGAKRRSVAVKSLDRGIPRGGMSVKTKDGAALGEVTSGTFSPSLKVGIGIALLDASVKIGDQLVIDVRGRDSIVEVVKLPFMPSHVR
jgi:aminomethyltransferase